METVFGSTEFFLALCLIVLYYIYRAFYYKKRKLPPGPKCFPVIGYLPFLYKNIFLEITRLAQSYGNIFSVRLGSRLIVVLNGSDAIKEAYVKPELLGKFPDYASSVLSKNNPMMSTNPNIWLDQRKFVLQALKTHGSGKAKIERVIQEEVQDFLEVLRTYKGRSKDILDVLDYSIGHIFLCLFYGEGQCKDSERKIIDARMKEGRKFVNQSGLHTLFPWIQYVPLINNRFDVKQALDVSAECDALLKKKIEQHLQTLDPNKMRDLVDSYLTERKLRMEKDFNSSFNDEALIATFINFFVIGTLSMSGSMSWCAYIMAIFPDIQDKVQREIFNLLGPKRKVKYEDKMLLPYTSAVLLELLRWKSVNLMGSMRYTTDDVNVCGYTIPKHTLVYGNSWRANFDPKHWKDPDSFIPERFLSEDRKSVINIPHFTIFSYGKRKCPGETLAKMEMFLYFVSLLQNFNIRLPQGDEKPDLNIELWLTFRLKSHKLCFISRT